MLEGPQKIGQGPHFVEGGPNKTTGGLTMVRRPKNWIGGLILLNEAPQDNRGPHKETGGPHKDTGGLKMLKGACKSRQGASLS